MADDNYYDLLGVTRDASTEEIKRAYRRLARTIHPDVAGPHTAALFRAVSSAHEVLSDPRRRAQYDRDLFASSSRPDDEQTPPARPGSQHGGSIHDPSTGRQTPNATRSGADVGFPVWWGWHLPRLRGALALGCALFCGIWMGGVTNSFGWLCLATVGTYLLAWITIGAASTYLSGGTFTLVVCTVIVTLGATGLASAMVKAAHQTSQLAAGGSPSTAPLPSVSSPASPPAATPDLTTQTAAPSAPTESAVAVAPPTPVGPATPTCAVLSAVRVSYQIASQEEIGGIGVDEWPHVTVHNGATYAITATFSGHGSATNPAAPQFPLQMMWGVDDPPLTVPPGHTSSEDLGKQFGEVLAVFNGGHVTSFVIRVSVSPATDDPTDPTAELACSLPVTRMG